MTDFLLLEQLQKIIKDVMKPKLMCRKGITAGGYFRPYMSFGEYTKAQIFDNIDEITPVTVRFSSMLGDKGTADTIRNIKVMSSKFIYGNKSYDVVCQSIPVMMIEDVNKILEVIKVFSNEENFDGINKHAFWKFIVDNPEATLFAVMLYSNLGISDSYINIKYYSVNNYIWQNAYGERFMVRYKWMPVPDKINGREQVSRPLNRNAAEFIAGYDPNKAHNEIKARIRYNKFPLFELFVQLLKIESRVDGEYIDPTIIWNEDDAPYIKAGILVIDHLKGKMENEQIWFSTSDSVEGIEVYRNDISDLLDFVAKTESLERGTYL